MLWPCCGRSPEHWANGWSSGSSTWRLRRALRQPLLPAFGTTRLRQHPGDYQDEEHQQIAARSSEPGDPFQRRALRDPVKVDQSDPAVDLLGRQEGADKGQEETPSPEDAAAAPFRP